jgi:hypothetical protein
MITGRIPKNLLIVEKPEISHRTVVDEKEYLTAVKPAFAVDVDSEKMVATARSWGTHERYKKVCDVAPEFTGPNDSFTDLQLIDLEKRSEGGCAYKVVDGHGRLYDLREGIFLECLYSGEIEKRGDGVFLTGEFIWAVNGSQMKIVRVGSCLYEKLKEAGERRQLVVLKRKDLKPGYVYRMKSKDEKAYLGWAKGKGMLMVELSWDKRLTLQERLDAMLDRSSNFLWNIGYTKSCAFVEEVGPVKVPDGIFERVDRAIEHAQEQARRDSRMRRW